MFNVGDFSFEVLSDHVVKSNSHQRVWRWEDVELFKLEKAPATLMNLFGFIKQDCLTIRNTKKQVVKMIVKGADYKEFDKLKVKVKKRAELYSVLNDMVGLYDADVSYDTSSFLSEKSGDITECISTDYITLRQYVHQPYLGGLTVLSNEPDVHMYDRTVYYNRMDSTVIFHYPLKKIIIEIPLSKYRLFNPEFDAEAGTDNFATNPVRLNAVLTSNPSLFNFGYHTNDVPYTSTGFFNFLNDINDKNFVIRKDIISYPDIITNRLIIAINNFNNTITFVYHGYHVIYNQDDFSKVGLTLKDDEVRLMFVFRENGKESNIVNHLTFMRSHVRNLTSLKRKVELFMTKLEKHHGTKHA